MERYSSTGQSPQQAVAPTEEESPQQAVAPTKEESPQQAVAPTEEEVSIKHNLIYSLITIRLATRFDPIGSSSGLHYEPINVRKLPTSLGSQRCLQR